MHRMTFFVQNMLYSLKQHIQFTQQEHDTAVTAYQRRCDTVTSRRPQLPARLTSKCLGRNAIVVKRVSCRKYVKASFDFTHAPTDGKLLLLQCS